MPFVVSQGAEIYYEIHGEGPPLVMIPGLATGTYVWSLQVAALKRHFQCVLIDNRGAGRSHISDTLYTTAMMAEDVLSILDELGTPRANVLGFSFGGAIAQELALAHPEKISRMILSNSFACIRGKMSEKLRIWKEMAQKGLMDQFCNDLVEEVFTKEHLKKHSRKVKAFKLAMTAKPPSALGLLRQIEAVGTHDTRVRLARIGCPTLVLTSQEDRIVPPELSEELASGIPGARFYMFSQAGHAVFVEQANLYNNSIMGFLDGAV